MKKWSEPQIKNLTLSATCSTTCPSFQENPNPTPTPRATMPDWVAKLGCMHCLNFGLEVFNAFCKIYNDPELEHGCDLSA